MRDEFYTTSDLVYESYSYLTLLFRGQSHISPCVIEHNVVLGCDPGMLGVRGYERCTLCLQYERVVFVFFVTVTPSRPGYYTVYDGMDPKPVYRHGVRSVTKVSIFMI